MTEQEREARDILQASHAVMTGHFILFSRMHAREYVNKDAISLYPYNISRLCQLLAEQFINDRVGAVIAPAVAGVILSQWTAFHLGQGVAAVYADKEGRWGQVVRRGFGKTLCGSRVLVVEDVISTGKSVREVIEGTRLARGIVVGVAVLVNRGGVAKEVLEVPKLVSLVDIPMEAWLEEECPLCRDEIPIDEGVGHGREYLANRRNAKKV